MTTTNGAGQPAEREREGGWIVWLVVVVLLVVAAGAYAGSRYWVGDRVPRGTTVSGVDVGGMTRDDAEQELREEFADRDEATIEVAVDDDRTATVRPQALGMAVDYEATLDAAGAQASWSPGRQWDFFGGGEDVDAVVEFDDRALETTLQKLSRGLGTPPKDGRVVFTKKGTVRTVDPQAGREIEREPARATLAAAYLAGDGGTAQLDLVDAQPEIDADDVAEAVEQVAEPAVSGPVTFEFDDARVKLGKSKVAQSLRMAPVDGALELRAKQKKLVGFVEGATSNGDPVDARVELVRGQPKVVPGKPGISFDPAEVSSVFLDLVGSGGGNGRSGAVEAEVEQPGFTTKDAEELKITEKVSEFTTSYPHSEYRNVNIGQAAQNADGTLLKPGDTFSMNDIVGERTAANGFTEGYIISNGILKKDYGGGVSQLATTLFNAMFFAGLEDIEHKPHSFYIDRYPVGREATVAWPTVDLRFRNDTDYGVLVHSYINPSSPGSTGSVTVEMYSTKIWDITASKSERYAYTQPETRYIQEDGCEAHTGYSGFKIDVTRTFRRAGEDAVDHTEEFNTTYTPSDSVVCGPPPGQGGNGGNGGGGNGGDGGGGGNNRDGGDREGDSGD
ncbi:VanW family protein [Nocardioides panacisoli]|uniref:VanW family protein n=1 Tax=Nocardioides panacisoli TaxID=627624 RepID=UPI001C62D4D8|nr:VanW family protein [Nocardioides panacisoli]QYJ04122.1 VanW family protein [Nocardioides panacisoli]